MMTHFLNILLLTLSNKSNTTIMKNFLITSEMLNILIMITLTFYLVLLMNFKEIEEEKSMFMNLLLISNMTLVAMAMVCECPFKYLVLMEMSMMPLAYYIIKTSKEQDSKEAVLFMVILNSMGSIPFMMYASYNAGIVYFEVGKSSSNIMMMASMLLFLSKTPLFMIHFWLTKAHVAASGCCSMILASVMIKLGSVGIYKFLTPLNLMMPTWVMAFSVWAMVILTSVMIRHFDLKTLIATSSVLHMGMISPMMILKSSYASTSCVMMMTSHGLISSFLFYLLTVMYEKAEGRSNILTASQESKSGVGSMMFTVTLLLNMGLPPFMNFISETVMMGVLIKMSLLTTTFAFMMVLVCAMIFTYQSMSYASLSKPSMIEMKSFDLVSVTSFAHMIFWLVILIFFL